MKCAFSIKICRTGNVVGTKNNNSNRKFILTCRSYGLIIYKSSQSTNISKEKKKKKMISDFDL